MFVIPKKDFSVVDPQRMDVLPPEGRDVGADHPVFWNRRISDGDVTLVTDKDVPAAKAALERAEAQRVADAHEKSAADQPQKAPADGQS